MTITATEDVCGISQELTHTFSCNMLPEVDLVQVRSDWRNWICHQGFVAEVLQGRTELNVLCHIFKSTYQNVFIYFLRMVLSLIAQENATSILSLAGSFQPWPVVYFALILTVM